MRTIQSWLDEYGESHRSPVNKRIHWVCVPLIMLSVLGMIWFVPFPDFFKAVSPYLNWATLLIMVTLVYYALLSPRLAAGMLIVSAVMCLVLELLARRAGHLLWIWVVVFVAAWGGQFIGHKIEGKKPSFFKDIQFLLIGPVWLLAAFYHKLGLAY